MNPFHALQMEEDDESEDEETEEIKDMQISPAHTVPRMPQCHTKKHSEREDSSVGSMQCPTKGGKLDITDVTDTVVEQEEKWMEVDVSTITSSPDDDDLLMREDTKEDAFRYDDNLTQVDPKYLKSHNSLESIFDSEEALDSKIQPLFEADKVGIGRQLQEDGKEASSQTSDEVE